MLSREVAIRISELSRTSGASVATIKYYLREDLLPPGGTTARNQAVYSQRHVHRLRLIRVLREVGGLGIDAIREVAGALDNPRLSRHELLGVAHRAVSSPAGHAPEREVAEVDALLRDLEWVISTTAPDRGELARALASLRALGRDVDARTFLPYARAVEPLAAFEVASVSAGASDEAALEATVVGTVVYGAALAALRRLAQEHQSALASGPAG
ncbi:MAG: MerR family transcriptional regulator [Nitriliruptorales bacterium]|nr:MerR family transcriptional regulator [Nitriliruptorales bacterium]